MYQHDPNNAAAYHQAAAAAQQMGQHTGEREHEGGGERVGSEGGKEEGINVYGDGARGELFDAGQKITSAICRES